jgi:hypothetical protein
VATTKERLDKHDKQIAAIREIINAGMRLVYQEKRLGFEARKEIRDLAAAQKKTEQSLQAFIDSMRRGGNGHVKPARPN